jgi:signal transduction histidine kinase
MAQAGTVARIGRWSKALARIPFFWQLIATFVLVIVLVEGGMLVAGRVALTNLEPFALSATPASTRLWTSRMADFYARTGSWQGVDALLAQYPCGPDWAPWDSGWDLDYALANADGRIIEAGGQLSGSVGSQLDQVVRRPLALLTTPIVIDGEQVGSAFVAHLPALGERSLVYTWALRGLILTGVAIGLGTLVLGLALSRGVSRPLVRLAEATHAVAAGDFGVRVETRYPGEVGDLARAFNRMTAELARADDLRRRMTADVAHELRTPLSVVRGKLEGVLDGVYPPTPEHLEPVLEETKLLAHLVEDLQLLALAEAGQLVLDRQPLAIDDMLRDTVVNFAPQATDRGVSLTLTLPEGLPVVCADRRRVAQVLGNLLTNALRHTPRSGCVRLSAVRKGGSVEVAVEDSGSGIAPADLPFIFERFWRGDKSRARASGGSGLGLAIARRLVELQGGTITAENAPQGGADFRFTLPTEAGGPSPLQH